MCFAFLASLLPILFRSEKVMAALFFIPLSWKSSCLVFAYHSVHVCSSSAHVKNEKKLVLEKASLVIDKLQYIKFNDYQRQGLTSLYTDWISSEVMEWKNSLLFIEESLQKIVDRIKKGGMLSDDQEAVGCCLIKNIVPQCWIVSLIILHKLYIT